MLRGSILQARSSPLILSVTSTVPERTLGPSWAASASSSARVAWLVKHGRGGRHARTPQEIAPAVAGRPAGFSGFLFSHRADLPFHVAPKVSCFTPGAFRFLFQPGWSGPLHTRLGSRDQDN